MNLSFSTVSKIDRAGVPCLVQRAVIPQDYRYFWMIWKTVQDPRLKETLSLRKEAGKWAAYRIMPADDALAGNGPLPAPYFIKNRSLLLPYQPDAVAQLTRAVINYGTGIDGSDTGLGKTYVALAVCRELGLHPAIICRKAGIAGWKRACSYMGLDPVYIVNWEYARTGKFKFIPREHHAYEPRWIFRYRTDSNVLHIFDECHMACNDDTINNNLMTSIKGRSALFLSATLADRPARLASLLELVGVSSRQEYRSWLVRRGYLYNAHNELESLSSVQDMIEINKVLYPRHGVRLSYQDEDVRRFFPEAVYQIELVTIDRPDVQDTMYRNLIKKAVEYRDMGKAHADIMVAELRYRQAAEILKVRPLVELAREYMDEGKSVVIFVNFRETMMALAAAFSTRSLIFGEQERYKIDREKVIADFQANKQRLIVSMIQAGGQSISLHDLEGGHQRVSLICPTYNPIDLRQVLGRTYRAGSRSTPIMKLVYAGGTVEEKVSDTVRAKLANIDALNRGDLYDETLFQKVES